MGGGGGGTGQPLKKIALPIRLEVRTEHLKSLCALNKRRAGRKWTCTQGVVETCFAAAFVVIFPAAGS
jgi:hypothetical protein